MKKRTNALYERIMKKVGHIVSEAIGSDSYTEVETTVGSKMDNGDGTITYYGDRTANGLCFKDREAFEAKEGVCYITEYGLDQNGSLTASEADIAKLVEDGTISTYHSMYEEACEYCKECGYDLGFAGHITEWVFGEIDWQSFSTLMNEIDFDEDYKIWQNETVSESKKSVSGKKSLNEGAGAGYTITLKGIEIDIDSILVNMDKHYFDEDYDKEHDTPYVEWRASIKPGYVDFWSAEDYYYAVDSNGIVLDGQIVQDYDEEDRRVDGGTVMGVVSLEEVKYEIGAESIEDVTREDVLSFISDNINSKHDFKDMFGGGWSHASIGDEDIIFGSSSKMFKDIHTDDYVEFPIYLAEVNAREISQDIDWYFEHDFELDEIFRGEEESDDEED